MNPFMTFFIKNKEGSLNMRLIYLTLYRVLHRQGYCHVSEQEDGEIVIEAFSKESADFALKVLDRNGLVWD
jgi:hypothetical protein